MTDAQRAADPRLAFRTPEELRAIADDLDLSCKVIREALLARSGKVWSVTRSRGTAHGWLRIKAPPRRCGQYGDMTPEDALELARLLGKDKPHLDDFKPCRGGESIPSSGDYREEYLALALGLTPTKIGTPYWD